jgi:carbonic anhydrase
LEYIVNALKPSIEKAKTRDGKLWQIATKVHIQSVREQLAQVPVMANAIHNGILEIVGGWYDLETGVVEILKS